MSPADPDLFARPDPESLIQLPWKPDVGWVAADLWMDGKPVRAMPPKLAQKSDSLAAEQGLKMKQGSNANSFLILPTARNR